MHFNKILSKIIWTTFAKGGITPYVYECNLFFNVVFSLNAVGIFHLGFNIYLKTSSAHLVLEAISHIVKRKMRKVHQNTKEAWAYLRERRGGGAVSSN